MSDGRIDYAAAGVNLRAADNAKERIRKIVESTFTPGVRGAFGGFGGMYALPQGKGESVLVASADGVGTKIRIAIAADRHDTIGHDLVNHCVNDILVQGARPLFFLDYVAFGKLLPEVAELLVAGVAAGCRENGCALIGGETAEMPGLYQPPDYDLAGFIVGVVDAQSIHGAEHVRDGDALVALESTGLHTNGYSLARKVVFDVMGLGVHDAFPGENASVADVMLRVHRSYLSALHPLLGRIHAMAHITGSGIRGNLNRAMPRHLSAVVDRSTWTPPNVFRVLQARGGMDSADMFSAFNMGVGMMVVCDDRDVDAIVTGAAVNNIRAWRAGRVVVGDGSVVWA